MTWLESTAKNAANLKGVEVLPCHRLGASKYRQLDMDYPMKDMASHTDAQLAQIQTLLPGFDLPARIVKYADWHVSCCFLGHVCLRKGCPSRLVCR